MLHTLHAVVEDDALKSPEGLLKAVKALGVARALVDSVKGGKEVPLWSPETCRAAIRTEAPLVFVASHAHLEVITSAKQVLDNSEVFVGVVDYNPDDEPLEEEPQHDEEPEEDRSAEIYHLALVMMAQSKGDPLLAAINAYNMAAVSRDTDHLWAVIAALVHCFPWTLEGLQKAGILADEADDEVQ